MLERSFWLPEGGLVFNGATFQLLCACSLQHCLVGYMSGLAVHVCSVLHQGRQRVLCCFRSFFFAFDLPTLGFTKRSGVPFRECFKIFHTAIFSCLLVFFELLLLSPR